MILTQTIEGGISKTKQCYCVSNNHLMHIHHWTTLVIHYSLKCKGSLWTVVIDVDNYINRYTNC